MVVVVYLFFPLSFKYGTLIFVRYELKSNIQMSPNI